MAKAAKTPAKKTPPKKKAPVKPKRSFFWWIGVVPFLAIRWGIRAIVAVAVLVVLWVALYTVVNPPSTIFIMQEVSRLDETRREWRDFETISSHMPHAIVAAEDANFCNHWGFDMAAIRDALEDGGGRGASTISQQTVKNVFLWHGRNWTRKAMEAAITPVMEAFWSTSGRAPRRDPAQPQNPVGQKPVQLRAAAGAQHCVRGGHDPRGWAQRLFPWLKNRAKLAKTVQCI